MRNKCEKCKQPTSCCDCMKTQYRTQYCFDRNHDHTIGADTNSSFWCRTCHPYGRLVSSKTEPQDRTIRDVKSIVEELSRLYLKFLEEEEATGVQVNYWSNDRVSELVSKLELKQPEKQEIDVSHEVTADMADFNDVVYNRDCIIELQKVVNKLLK